MQLKKVKYVSLSPYYTPHHNTKKVQLAKVDVSKPVTDKQIKLLQQVCNTFLYYVWALDCTMLYEINN